MPDRWPVEIGIGMPWYERDEFPHILQIMADADRLHRTFDEWEEAAKHGEANLTASGRIVVRAHINPDQFIAWCAENDLRLDARARNQFAAEVAHRELVGRSE